MKVTQLFKAIWNHLARMGAVDAFGGMECRRVWREWRAAGCPYPVSGFILRHANAAPHQASPRIVSGSVDDNEVPTAGAGTD